MTILCPLPPAVAGAVEITRTTLGAGTTLIRFHSPTFPVTSFNPNLDKFGAPRSMHAAEEGARFSPFPDHPGVNVPILYAGTTEKSAALESVFHDVPHIKNPDFSAAKLHAYRMSNFSVVRNLVVIDLIESELRQVTVPGRTASLHEHEIVHSEPDQYPQTRAWGQYFHRSIPELQGLRWRPRLGGEGDSYVFFGDRVSAPDDFMPLDAPLLIHEGPGRTKIDGIAKTSHINII